MSSSISTNSTTRSIDVCSILLNNDYAKSVSVSEAKQHQDGYTVYKIVLQAIRAKKTIDDDPLTYVIWKRFRDLHKLHRRISIVHAQLYLKGVVPTFPKPDFFGRLEPSVVEERRQASHQFLAFTVQNPVLCQCEAVLAFFSGAECQQSAVEKPSGSDFESNIPSSSASGLPPPITPQSPSITAGSIPPRLPNIPRSFSESSDMSDDLSLYSPTESKPPVQQQQRRENAGDSELLTNFDPFLPSSSSFSSDLGGGSNFRILNEAMAGVQVTDQASNNGQGGTISDNHQDDDEIRGQSPSSYGNDSNMTISVSFLSDDSKNISKLNNNTNAARWRSKIADFFPRMSPSSSSKFDSVSPSSTAIVVGEMKSMKLDDHSGNIGAAKSIGGKAKNKIQRGGGSPGAPSGVTTRRSSLDYVLQAAEFISSAQKAEEEGAFDLSFTCYKSAVMLLLQGVQDEKDLNRRNAVRLKTAKYLKKAEKLYTTHIATDTNSSFCLDGFTSRFLSNFGIMGFQSVYSELAQYKVVRILGRKVQLVQDLTSGEKLVVKILDKSCYSGSYSATKILDQCVPTRVPHMVKLVKFWDTETAVVLLLEYAAGGSLWNRLRSYFERIRRIFRRYYERKNASGGGGDEEKRRSLRRSGSVDALPGSIAKHRSSAGSFRHRSESDPNERQSRSERNRSAVASCDDEDEQPHDELDETTTAGRLCAVNENEPSLFAMYERKSKTLRRSTEDSFSLDTAPSSAAPTSKNRKFSFLYAENHLPNEAINEVEEELLRKWIAQITVALGYLHGEGVLCKDLNPANLLLDAQDNVLLTFFCDWNGVDRSFNPGLSSMLYSAPEVDGTVNEPLTDAADWWSLGVILYEIVTGVPLHTQCPHGVGTNTIIPLPDYLSVELRDLITRLIRCDAEDRLGACFGGVDEIKMHPFFMEFDWHTVE